MLREILERFDETVVINEEVSKNIEITKYLLKYPRNPVYFKNVDGYELAGNIWSTRERISNALKSKNLIKDLSESIKNPMDYDVVDENPFIKSKDFSLKDLPIPKFFQGDGSNYITSGIVFSEWNGKRNVSFHRFMVLDEKRAAIRLVPRDLYRMYNEAQSEGKELKITLVVGSFITFLLAAATSVDYQIDESKIASSIRFHTLGNKEKMVKIENIYVPVESEYIFTGVITSEKIEKEGPFVDITKTYDVKNDQPIVLFEKMYTIKEPIFHAILPGGYEHYNLMGLPREPTIYNEILREGVDVLDLKLTEGGCSWLHCVIKIRKKNEDDGKRALMAAFRGHKSLKHAVVVDEDINIDNMEDVEWAIATRFQGDRDMIMLKERGSSLDPSSYPGDITTKIGIDATKKGENKEKYERVF